MRWMLSREMSVRVQLDRNRVLEHPIALHQTICLCEQSLFVYHYTHTVGFLSRNRVRFSHLRAPIVGKLGAHSYVQIPISIELNPKAPPRRGVDDVAEEAVARVLDSNDAAHHSPRLQAHAAPHRGQPLARAHRLVQLVMQAQRQQAGAYTRPLFGST